MIKEIFKCLSCGSTDISQKASIWIDVNNQEMKSNLLEIEEHWFEDIFFCGSCNRQVKVKIYKINKED